MTSREEFIKCIKNYIVENNIPVDEVFDQLQEIKVQVICEMMKEDGQFVLKSKGTVEAFDPERLYYSIANASDSTKKSMTAADINAIVRGVRRTLFGNEKRKVATHVDVANAVVEELKDMNFLDFVGDYLANTVARNFKA